MKTKTWDKIGMYIGLFGMILIAGYVKLYILGTGLEFIGF